MIEILRDILKDPSLQLYLFESWSSEVEGHRQVIHQFRDQQVDLFDSSISHSKGLGGLVTSRKARVGLDIEVSERVKDHIVQRVCRSQDEFNAAPTAAHLWVAKEAAFKALKGPSQPQLISEITVSDWQKSESQIETYRLIDRQNLKLSNNQGAVFLKPPFIISVFTVFP
jgi:4'-phosphopantetheinyl transferase